MATAKPLPLPPDYVRPSPAEFKAAGFAPSEYESFFSRHEAELRTHHARVSPPVVTVSAEEEVPELDVLEDVTDPTDTEPAPPSEPPGPPMSLAEMAAARAGTPAAPALVESVESEQPENTEEHGPAETDSGAGPAVE